MGALLSSEEKEKVMRSGVMGPLLSSEEKEKIMRIRASSGTPSSVASHCSTT